MFSRLLKLLKSEEETAALPKPGAGLVQVTADASRCVQCGICGYNCPVGIQVREYARRGQNVTDSRCISCGACIEKCPRGTLRWGPAVLLGEDNRLEVDPDALPILLRLEPREAR
ncbi:MAG: 4Fe-4S dicluster domain-containing protein [Chloroflexi bacterium]|nr:4Fe-4S dicluster domain-containing protein [Chloroflexota bacterium]MCI0578545.1 4Fe-4S dicluster domain-containing protein [Chloroflexota bacterium]MCI0647459.1 4Fe-4S dicluster domain-containing protein [Chloroflexota bacterium]MCI0728739.1 4Fe-4S dicluster domain-containing protein [Chloroflexota bacterium]